MAQQSNTVIPATAIALAGQHLIEASAGTGKTWTLTGIVLRLLIEAKRPPEKIICTTFTRAAAAEMRERILERLNEFYHLLLWVEKVSQQPDCQKWLFNFSIDKNTEYVHSDENKDLIDDLKQENSQELYKIHEPQKKEFRQIRQVNLFKIAQSYGLEIKETIEDPVNIHLLHYLFDNYLDYPLSIAIRRTQLLLISMDKLFVSTLDSLAQKWLSEYSAETGFQKGMSISDADEDIISDIIHDEIRKFHAKLYSEKPQLYDLLQQTGKLTSVNDHISSVTKALSFISSPIDKISGFDFNNYQMQINRFIHHEINDVSPYFNEDYKKKKGLNGKTKFSKLIHTIKDITNAVKQYKELYLLYLNSDSREFLEQVSRVIIDSDNKGFGFNKNCEKERYEFINLPTIKLIYELYEASNSLDSEIDKLNYDILQAVRTRLPIQLEENNKTTFSLQMVRLNQALSGMQGKKLARYIRHHYPVALIDESQDINGEQSKMIQSIYMDNQSKSTSKQKTFLLLVGDPKQAIYGFRGGDVANYNSMKDRMKSDSAKVMTLNVNRRSSAGMIDSLNHWFTSDIPKLKELGEGIEYHQIEAFKGDSGLSWQCKPRANDTTNNSILGKKAVSIIHMPYDQEQKFNKYQIIATHIKYLLTSNETLDGKKIKANDIAILARRKADLHHAQWALERLNIPSIKTAEISVFSSKMAIDLLAILQAIHNPFDTRYVNRALMTTWYGLNLQQIKKLESEVSTILSDKFSEYELAKDKLENENNIDTHSDTFRQRKINYYDFQLMLQQAQKRWIDYGVMSAVQYLLSNNPFSLQTFDSKTINRQKVTVWEQLAQYKDAERYLLDLRQLLELLAHHSRGLGEVEIIDWLVNQNSQKPTDEASIQHSIPTESGVQLMTIHKSKGLEFPIVYVLGMDSNSKINSKGLALYPYIALNKKVTENNTNSGVHRRLSVVKVDNKYNYQELVHKDELGEAKRVSYVALTRASEKVYIFLKDQYSNKDLDYIPANIWLESNKDYYLPSRLEGYVDWIESSDIINSNNSINNIETINSNELCHLNDSNTLIKMNYPSYESVIRKRYFVGWSKTSFTALSRQLNKNESDIAISEPDYVFEDMVSEDITETLLSARLPTIEPDIRFNFVKGAGAGTFLHQILEKIDFNNPDTWSEEIDRGIREYGLPMQYASPQFLNGNQQLPLKQIGNSNIIEESQDQHQQLKSWISDILHMSMLASKERLVDLKPNQRKAELGFDLGLSDNFRVEKINEVFAKHLDINGKDSDKLINLSTQNTPYFYRYLRGEIDLVYEYAGKYYIVDYKSNHLGNKISDYTIENLNIAMSKSGYWLQAVIYQVALHRLLKLRISDYEGNEDKYLGAVEYIFLRGCVRDGGMNINLKDQYEQCGQQSGNYTYHEQNYDMFETMNDYGKVIWDIPIALIKNMDELFSGSNM